MSYIGAIRSILLYTPSEKVLPERCNQKDARKMLSDVVLNADEKMLLFRCYWKDATGEMLYAGGKGVVGKMLPERCYWEDASLGAFGKMLS